MKAFVRRMLSRRRGPNDDIALIHEQNFGVDLLEWPERATYSVAMLEPFHAELGVAPTGADWGCGKQIIRRLIPPDWAYVPYDRIPRSPDTRLHDFNGGAPAETADVVFCLGLLEYVDDFWGVLGAAINQSRFCIFSYAGPTTEERRLKNGWKWNVTVDEIAAFIDSKGSTRLAYVDRPATGHIFLVRGVAGDA